MLRKWMFALVVAVCSLPAFSSEAQAFGWRRWSCYNYCYYPCYNYCYYPCYNYCYYPCYSYCYYPSYSCCYVSYWNPVYCCWQSDSRTYTAAEAQTRVAQLQSSGYTAYSRY